MQKKLSLPQGLLEIMDAIRGLNGKCYLVGGAIRDLLLDKEPKDYDLVTDMALNEVSSALGLPRPRKGTIAFHREHIFIDLSRFVEEDIDSHLRTRDFTINALAYDGERLFDPNLGQEDIRRGVIRACGDPRQRFEEDPIRILRALRFQEELGFAIDKETEQAIHECCKPLEWQPHERVDSELRRIIISDDIERILTQYQDVFCALFPLLRPIIGFDQHNRWHGYELYTHTVHVVRETKPDFLLRYAAILHDIGKPHVAVWGEDKQLHFPKHGQKGTEMLIMEEFYKRLSSKETEEILLLVALHDDRIEPTRKSVRKWLSMLAIEHKRLDPLSFLDRLMDLKRADHRDHTTWVPVHEDEVMGLAKQILMDRDPLRPTDLALSAKDLMSMGYEGDEIGKALRYLLEQYLEGNVANEASALRDALKLRH